MNEQDSEQTSWRTFSRIKVGPRKGQFKRRREKSTETRETEKSAKKRLCVESSSAVNEEVVSLEKSTEPITASVVERTCNRKRKISGERREIRKRLCKESKDAQVVSDIPSENESSKSNIGKVESHDVQEDVLAGRELHEPSILAAEMWCNNCDIPLSFRFAQGKVQKGLAFIYDIRCYQCKKVKAVKTSQVFRDKAHDLFVVNAKAAVGIIDSGIAETQFNLLLSAMNVSTVSDTLLKRYERIVGPKIEELAKESCCEVLEEEIDLAKKANDIVKDK